MDASSELARSLVEADHAEALREDWARGRVAAAGKSWTTHLTKFDGTVLRRESPSDGANRMARTIQRQLRRSAVPDGLCAQRGDHPDHEHTSESLGRFWCTGREADREPGRSERARS